MATFVSPGVYIQEKDDSLYAPAISPAIIGIVGTATKGPLNEAHLVTSEGQLVDLFGRPRSKDLGMQTAIEALKTCRLIYFVRIAGAAAAKGLVNVNDTGSGPTSASIGPSANAEPFNFMGVNSVESPIGTRTATIRFDYDNGGGPVLNADATVVAVRAQRTSGNPETYNLNAIAAGGPVTMRVKVDGGPDQVITVTSASVTGLGGNYAAVTAAILVQIIDLQIVGGGARLDLAGTSVIIHSDTYGNNSSIQILAPLAGGNLNDAINGLNFNTAIQTVVGSDAANLAAITGAEFKAAVQADIPALVVDVSVTGNVTIHTATAGATRALKIITASGPNTIVGSGTGRVNLTPLDTTVNGTASAAAAPTIRFTAATNGSHSSRIKVRISSSASLVGTQKVEILLDDSVAEIFDRLYKGTPVAGGTEMITTINNGSTNYTASELVVASDLNVVGGSPANNTYTLSAGNDGDNWTSGSVIGSIIGSTRTGMQIFRDPDQIYINLLATPGISYAAVIAEGIDIASTRADCLYIADAPSNLDAEDVVKWHNGDSSVTAVVDQEARTETNSTVFNSSYAALYWPFLTMFDKYNDTNHEMPPSALVLRTIGYTDAVADPWFAPAGPNRTQGQSVLDLAFNPSQGERDLMQMPGNNVNPVASISGVGVVLMGQKTLQRAPTALDRVNVRRLMLAIEKVVAQTVFFLMFEPNDSVMWRRFVNLVEPPLKDIKSRRGLFDFKVIADSSTTTPLLIDQNTFLGKIFLQPVKAAEKIIVSFNITPTGTNFQEFVTT